MVQIKNKKRFPVTGHDLKMLDFECQNVYNVTKSRQLTGDDGKRFSPDLPKMPEKVLYTAYQIPKGEIIGIQYSLSPNGKNPLTYLNSDGTHREAPVLSEAKNAALWKMILGLNINYSLLSDDKTEYSTIVFWFILGGRVKGVPGVYGADHLNPFLLLIAVDKDGQWLRPSNFYKRDEAIAVSMELRANRMLYLNEFKYMANLSTQDTSRMGGLLKDFLKRDEIHSNILNIGYNEQGSPAWGVLLVPDYGLFYNRPVCWSIVKATDL